MCVEASNEAINNCIKLFIHRLSPLPSVEAKIDAFFLQANLCLL